MTDDLGEDGFSGGVFGDGPEDIRVESRVLMDAEVFGDIEIWPAEFLHYRHERQVGNVLHGRKNEGGGLGKGHWRVRSGFY